MEEHNILDEMIAEDQVEILKAAMPYLPAQGQRLISVYAKFLELSNTIRLFSQPQADMQMHAQEQFTADPLAADLRRKELTRSSIPWPWCSFLSCPRMCRNSKNGGKYE